MADRDSWYDLEWKTYTHGINFILTNKGIFSYSTNLKWYFSTLWVLFYVMCYTSRMKDFAFVSPQKYPGDLLAGKVTRDFGLQVVFWR